MDGDILKTFWKRVKKTYNPRWSMVELAKGDIRSSLDRSFSQYSQRFINTVKRCDGPHTVLWIRNTDLQKWRAVRGIPAIRQCIGEVFAEEDGRRLFPKIYSIADEIKEKRKQASKKRKVDTGKV